MPLLAKWRAHDVFRAVEARLVVVVDREEEVLGACLGVCRQAAVAEEPDLLERLRGREMDDVKRDAAGHLGEPEGAVGRLTLGLGWPRQRMPLRPGVLRG